jgi:sugar/nucleoside kinase (ribokinase family)
MFIVVGTSNVDLFLSGVSHLPAMGKDEFTTDNFVFSESPMRIVLGGNGGNCAYTLARLGAQVLLCSAVGRDDFGERIANWLAEVGVRLAGLVRSREAATSTTTILTDETLQRLSVHYRGASALFEAVRIPPGAYREKGVLLISSYPLLLGWRPERVATVLAEAHQAGVVTALDIGPAIGGPATLAEITGFLADVDYLLCNEHELGVCTGDPDPEASAARLLQAGARCVVLKRGRKGVTVFPGAWEKSPGEREDPFTIPAFEVDATSTVGAGDGFNAGFLYGVQREWPLQRAARFGNAVASLVVRSARGGLGAPQMADVERLLQKGG